MPLSLILGAAACFALLGFKYMTARPEARNRATPKQRLKMAHALIAAVLALLAINYKLAQTGRDLDGNKSHKASWFEKFVLSRSE